MATHIRFRLNKISGEIEEFLVDDQDRTLSEAEHDRIATEVGQVIARYPRIAEVVPVRGGATRPVVNPPVLHPDVEGEQTPVQNTPVRES